MEELKKEIDKIRIGNYLKYIGKLYKYRDHIGEVTSIDELNQGEESYSLQMFDYNKQPIEEIRAYEDEVRDLPLREDHLLNAGFMKEENISVYLRQNITVFAFSAFRSDGHGGTFELGDYWATTEYGGIPQNVNELDRLKERSVYVGRLHLFQNFMNQFFRTQVQY